MKKIAIIGILLTFTILSGCLKNQGEKINEENGISKNGNTTQEIFNNQINIAQYMVDLEDFYPKDYSDNNLTFSINTDIKADFDKNSSLQGGITFYVDKIKSGKDENSDIKFNITANKEGADPFESSGSLSLLYKNDNIYMQLHKFGLFMGEENMNAKMYTLLTDLIHDKWVDLEVHSGGIITIDEKTDISHIAQNLKIILTTENIQGNEEFLSNIKGLIDIINGYIDLGISTDELSLINGEISYYELGNEMIQKIFTGTFQGKESNFNLSFSASKEGLEIYMYNIKEYNEDYSNFKDIETELLLSIKENKKSEYLINLELSKNQQKVVDFNGNIKYNNGIKLLGNFVLEPLELVTGQKISGSLNGNITKEKIGDYKIPELSGDVLLLSSLISSL